jgi:DNA polymerase III alpha subunit
MIVRSEYSFRAVFGPIKEVVARLPAWGGVIADNNCWGHVDFATECKKAGKHGVLGARFQYEGRPAIVIPHSPAGLKELYATIAAGALTPERAGGADWTVVTAGRTSLPKALQGFFPGLSLASEATSIASSDNLFPAPEDAQAWALMLGKAARTRTGSAHILSPEELIAEGALAPWIERLKALIERCDTPLPRAENIKFPVKDPDAELKALATAELRRRKLGKEYKTRLEYELRLIAEKKFADYFLVIADLLQFAKRSMLVGPARGSSAGSVVCWLTRITEIDPLRHGLIFERFIDVNRADLPDIDIDFPDVKREAVIEYLREKYGAANVAHIGTVIRYKPRSALTDVAKVANVPLFELDQLKDVMIERSSGDARASACLADSLDGMEVGRALVAKYPLLRVATRLEDHARSAGIHAAGIVVCNAPVNEFCGVRDGACQLEKKTAETINLLKIDALGLRTLSVIEEACGLIGIDPLSLYELPLEDQDTFDMLNAGKYSGVFQFEGIALQSVARQFTIDRFEDVAAVTALARPGPLSSGETERWVKGKNTGTNNPLHPALGPFTEETFGTIIYQETVMRVVREMGDFSWADTSAIRKVMSGRKGNEAFAKYEKQFIAASQAKGLAATDAEKVWKSVNTMGSWAFNKSHAVAYGLLSYWTAWLKAHHPLEFAVANLRHAKASTGESDSTLGTLRELMRESSGIEFVPVDPEKSTERWEFEGKRLLGPLTGLKGCGPKTAREICIRRANGIALSARHKTLLAGVSRFADYAPAHRIWGDLYAHPEKHFKTVRELHECASVVAGNPMQQFAVLGRIIKKNLRDLNDEKYLVKRKGKRVPDNMRDMLLFNLEDDSGRVLCCVNAKRYATLGAPIVERAPIGQWMVVTGKVVTDFNMLQVERTKWLSEP